MAGKAFSTGGLAFLALCAALLVAGCGRRGPLEPPPGAGPAPASAKQSATARSQGVPPATNLATQPGANVQDTPEDETDSPDGALASVNPSPTPQRRTRPYAVPKEPFLLDPLL